MSSFTPLPDGWTHVSNTEVFAGFPVAVLRPLAALAGTVCSRPQSMASSATHQLTRIAGPGEHGPAAGHRCDPHAASLCHRTSTEDMAAAAARVLAAAVTKYDL